MKQHETHSRTGTIQALLRACWQGFRTITMCRRRGVRPAAAGPGHSAVGRRQGLAGQHTARSRTGVEGAGGTCRRAGGRRRGLAGLRDDAPSEARSADSSRAGCRPPAHTAAGPTSTRNVSGTTRNAGNPATYSTGAQARRPAPPNATTQTHLRSTGVRCRSARAARQSRRSSRSPRLRRRAGPRR